MAGARNVVLTGASSGIGAALARALAAPGTRFLLLGRDHARLATVAAGVRAAGAEVELALADVTDAAVLATLIEGFDDRHPVDLVIANAGMSAGRGPDGTLEGAETARRVIAVNLVGAVNTVGPLLARFAARRRGRIVLIASLAALRPHPDLPAYSAAKAGLRAWGTALRGALGPLGVGVTVVSPGFVTSPMSRRHRGFKPFEIPADDAAARILRGIARGAALVTFPWPLAVLIWLGNRLPPRLSDLAARGFAARIEPEGSGS